MLAVYLGIYILILAFVWGIFFVAQHHTRKFRQFSTFIEPVTQLLFFFLLILSITGAIFVFAVDRSPNLLQVTEDTLNNDLEGDTSTSSPSTVSPENIYY